MVEDQEYTELIQPPNLHRYNLDPTSLTDFHRIKKIELYVLTAFGDVNIEIIDSNIQKIETKSTLIMNEVIVFDVKLVPQDILVSSLDDEAKYTIFYRVFRNKSTDISFETNPKPITEGGFEYGRVFQEDRMIFAFKLNHQSGPLTTITFIYDLYPEQSIFELDRNVDLVKVQILFQEGPLSQWMKIKPISQNQFHPRVLNLLINTKELSLAGSYQIHVSHKTQHAYFQRIDFQMKVSNNAFKHTLSDQVGLFYFQDEQAIKIDVSEKYKNEFTTYIELFQCSGYIETKDILTIPDSKQGHLILSDDEDKGYVKVKGIQWNFGKNVINMVIAHRFFIPKDLVLLNAKITNHIKDGEYEVRATKTEAGSTNVEFLFPQIGSLLCQDQAYQVSRIKYSLFFDTLVFVAMNKAKCESNLWQRNLKGHSFYDLFSQEIVEDTCSDDTEKEQTGLGRIELQGLLLNEVYYIQVKAELFFNQETFNNGNYQTIFYPAKDIFISNKGIPAFINY